jgi:cytochrome c oxidase subunit 2
MESFWRLPETLSTFGADIDRLFYAVVWITGIVFVAVEVTLVVFLVKYRHREGHKAAFVHGNNKLEILWTGATAVIVLVLGLVSWGLWQEIKNPAYFPEPGLELEIAARQFEWNVKYPGADGELGTDDDYVVRNQLHVPVDTPVRITLLAEDVIHSFFVPELRLKQDAVPGMQIPVWFEATRAGDYTIGCAELCGLGHYRMRGAMTVHSADAFQQWRQERQVAAAGALDAGAAADIGSSATDAGGEEVAAATGATHVH